MKTVALLDVTCWSPSSSPNTCTTSSRTTGLRSIGRAGWATCPITETGVVRLLANPRFHAGIAVGAVVERLRRLHSDSAHEWWEANISLADPNLFQLSAVAGAKPSLVEVVSEHAE